ncbi:hypothetical protein OS493_002500 [Desmophyllum pertusum]|uniref:Methyltransferase type 11 domain-containing protein n=1 Tax=Desmophyllum pertusum TaxID=174260 RepID=A0A9W9YT44_9CNID|nr:hypothetical protein OS493_002500 [Desmophyllum pertusum]
MGCEGDLTDSLRLKSRYISTDYYRSVVEKYDYFFQEYHEARIPVLMKYLDLKPSHIVADIGSGTGFIAEQLYQLSGLTNPVWCVDPSAEMQEVAGKRKGLYPVQKTAEEFFSDPEINHNQVFDRVICAASSHHFVDPVAVYKGIVRSLRPGGFFIQVNIVDVNHPVFKTAENVIGKYSKNAAKEIQPRLLQEMNLQAKISHQEVTSPTMAVSKSKLYEIYRGRCVSRLYQLSDEQIEEIIKELENEILKDVKDDDRINYNYVFLVIKIHLD